jgi:hypothetical protein
MRIYSLKVVKVRIILELKINKKQYTGIFIRTLRL